MTNWALWGTIVNALLVLLGSAVGLLIRWLGKRVTKSRQDDAAPSGRGEALSSAIMGAVGLCVVLIGLSGALETQNMLVMIVSMALGTLVGSLLDLDRLVNRAAHALERKIGHTSGGLADGFLTASMVFCIGAMAVTGAMESGILHTHDTYYAKGLLDMVSATVFASTLGLGVAFSALAVFAVQGILTGIAVLAAGALPELIIGEMVAIGSLLVLCIGLNLMRVTKFKIMNFLPSMFLPILLCPLYSLCFG